MALGTTENMCLFVSASVFGLVSVWFLRLKTELILKIWGLNGFYFYNCFDTDWKKYLAGYGYFIFDNLVARREKRMKEGWQDTSFLYCFSVYHPFFFVLLLIGGLWAFSYQCNKNIWFQHCHVFCLLYSRGYSDKW